MTHWKHPHFGSFVFDGLAWVGMVHAPGFNVCSFITGLSVTEPPDGTYELKFDAQRDSDFPSQVMTELLNRLLANQNRLPLALGEILWSDFGPQRLTPGFEEEDLA